MIGDLLRERRQAKGLSQTELAALTQSSQRQISRLENGEERTMPRRETLERFGAVLGITLREFYLAAGLIDPADVAAPGGIGMASEVGPELRRMRQVRDWSQEELADRAGVEQTQISQWERGKVRPSLEMLAKLAAAFGVEHDDLARQLGYLAPRPTVDDLIERTPFEQIVALLRGVPTFAEHAQVEQADRLTPAARERLLRWVARDFGLHIKDELERLEEERRRDEERRPAAPLNGGSPIVVK